MDSKQMKIDRLTVAIAAHGGETQAEHIRLTENATEKVEQEARIPASTIRGWLNGQRNIPMAKLVFIEAVAQMAEQS